MKNKLILLEEKREETDEKRTKFDIIDSVREQSVRLHRILDFLMESESSYSFKKEAVKIWMAMDIKLETITRDSINRDEDSSIRRMPSIAENMKEALKFAGVGIVKLKKRLELLKEINNRGADVHERKTLMRSIALHTDYINYYMKYLDKNY